MSLLEKVASRGELLNAWLSIKHSPQSKGIDSLTIKEFADNLHVQLRDLGKRVRSRNYKFEKLRGHAVPKGPDSIRPLRIATIGDRVVQKSILRNVQGRLEKRFNINNPVSFAFTKGKTVRLALQRVRELYLSGYKWVYSGDIQTFFESIPPQQLLNDYIYPVLPDRTLDALILGALSNEIGNPDEMKRWASFFATSDRGIPQGSILSPTFANAYLTEFDQAMIRSEFEMVRYADDFVVMCKSEDAAVRAHELAKEIVEKRLKLKLHKVGGGKSKIERFNILDFLGFRFEGKRIYPGAEATKRMAKLLTDFETKTPDKTLIENLNYIRAKTNFWGAIYYYAEIDPKIYDHFDDSLAAGVVNAIRKHGFEPTTIFTPAGLSGIGIPTLTENTRRFRVQNQKEFLAFYPEVMSEPTNTTTANGQYSEKESYPSKNSEIPF